MPKSVQPDAALPKSPPGDIAPIDHARDWLNHVQAGRIGAPVRPAASLLEASPQTKNAHLIRHLRNEVALGLTVLPGGGFPAAGVSRPKGGAA